MRSDRIKANKIYRFIEFTPPCADNYKRKLMALGFLPGKIFQTLRCAPFGDPIELKINQTRLALRRHEAGFLNITEIKE